MAENTNPTETVSVTVSEPTSTPAPPKQENNYQKTSTSTRSSSKPKLKLLIIKLPLSFLTFLLSLPILGSIIWLLYVRDYDCEYLLKLQKLQYGIVIGLMLMFVLSNVALFLILRSRLPMPGLLLLVVPLMVMLIVGLALVGAYKMDSRTIPGSPESIKMNIFDTDNWNRIKSCIYDKSACKSLAFRLYMIKSYDFTATKLSPVESGCCRPPASCDMEYVNATFWQKGVDGGVVDSSNPYDTDCGLWTNDDTVLCYNCHACKEGFRRTIQHKWIILGSFLVAMAILLFIVHLLLFVVSMWETYGV